MTNPHPDNLSSSQIKSIHSCLDWKWTWFVFGCLSLGLLSYFIPDCIPFKKELILFGSFLQKYWFLDLLFLVALVLLLIQISTKIAFQNKYIIVGGLILLFFITITPSDRFVNWNDSISWKWIFFMIISMGILFISTHYFHRTNNTERLWEKDKLKGFVQKTEKSKLLNCGWNNYISSFRERLSNTVIEKENIAVGIIGSWGVGKSTFLEILQENMAKDCIVIKFNAWQCASPSDIVKYFFNQLVKNLDISEFGNDIKHYLKAIGLFDKNHLSGLLDDLLPSDSADSIDSIKERLNKHLEHTKKPVAIFIDDMDRMYGAELLELMKLIRVSANLSNIVIIAAYDKLYLINQLNNYGFKDGEEYLKKIFNLEISLQYPGISNINKLICEEISQHISDSAISTEIKNEITTVVHRGFGSMITNYVKNFRDAKLLVNSFLFSVQLIYKNHLNDEICWTQLFWIEVLRKFDCDVYNILFSNRDSILDSRHYGIGGEIYTFYIADSQINEKNSEKTKLKNSLSQQARFILMRLFSTVEPIPLFSIQRYYNFWKYFNISPTSYYLSVKEFRQLVQNPDLGSTKLKANEIINRGHASTLYQQVCCLQIEICDESHINLVLNSLVILIEIANHTDISSIPKVFRNFLNASKCKLNISNKVIELFQNNLKDYNHSSQIWNKIFSSIYPTTKYYDEDNIDSYVSILDKNIIENLACENCRLFLKNKNYKIQDIPRNLHPLNTFVKNACIKESELIQENDYNCNRKSLIFSTLKQHFAGTASPEDISAFLEFFNYYGEEYDWDIAESIEEDKEKLFGSIANYNGFLSSSKNIKQQPDSVPDFVSAKD